jgi:hypothetical protein
MRKKESKNAAEKGIMHGMAVQFPDILSFRDFESL